MTVNRVTLARYCSPKDRAGLTAVSENAEPSRGTKICVNIVALLCTATCSRTTAALRSAGRHSTGERSTADPSSTRSLESSGAYRPQGDDAPVDGTSHLWRL